MLKQHKKTLIFTSLIFLIPVLIGLLLWDRLPEALPSHWNIHGEADNWTPKAVAVLGFPAMLLALHWICVVALVLDPRRKNISPKMFAMTLWLCPILTLVLSSVMFAVSLDYDISVGIILPLLVGLLFVVIGNLLPKCTQNYTFGIRLPWTLASQENWNKTHRFSGKVMVLGGILCMATAFLANYLILLIILALMALLSTGYSFLYYLKHEKEAE